MEDTAVEPTTVLSALMVCLPKPSQQPFEVLLLAGVLVSPWWSWSTRPGRSDFRVQASIGNS